MELRDPSSEIEKLKFLLGSWRAEDKYESTPIIPGGGSGSGIYKTIFGPGNFSLLTDYSYEGPHGTTSGHQVLTWDAQKEQYAGFVVSSRSPGYILFGGGWEGPNLVLSGEFETHGMHVRFREVFCDVSSTTMTLRQYNGVDGAAEQLFGTTKFTKQ